MKFTFGRFSLLKEHNDSNGNILQSIVMQFCLTRSGCFVLDRIYYYFIPHALFMSNLSY